MGREIAARLGAARLVLEEAKGSASHEAVSRLQSRALLHLFATKEMTDIERASVSEQVTQLAWHGTHGLEVLNTLAEDGAGHGRARRRNQSFEALVEYGTAAFWEFSTSSQPGNAKLDKIIELAICVGLRCPTEPCLKFLTSWWILVSESSNAIQRMSRPSKQALYQHVKKQFDRARRLSADPVVYIVKLPSPIEFLRLYPQAFQLIFKGDAQPVAPPVDVKTIHELDATFWRRGGAVRGCAAQIPTVDLETPASSLGGVERVASMFLDRIDAMQQAQHRVLETLMHGRPMGSWQPAGSTLSLTDAMPFNRRQGSVIQLEQPSPSSIALHDGIARGSAAPPRPLASPPAGPQTPAAPPAASEVPMLVT